jgi:hypothetical protein
MGLIFLVSVIQLSVLHPKVSENQSSVRDDRKAKFAPSIKSTLTSKNDKNLQAKQYTSASKSPEKFCLVHVGKTGGGTLSCRFGSWLAKDCSKAKLGKSVLQRHVLGKLHKARDWGCLRREKHPKVWLFTLRSPIDRINSWFQYEHPKHGLINEVQGNRPLLYDDCFDSLEDLSLRGLSDAWKYSMDLSKNRLVGINETELIHAQKCAKRAWDAVTGSEGYQYHNFYNYGYYKRYIDSVMEGYNYSILVLRSEHLKEDWDGLEKLYTGDTDQIQLRRGQDGEYFDAVRRHSSNRTLHKDAYPQLCRALCEEIKVYKSILSAAKNLSPEQLQQSLDELQEQCGQARDDDCEVPEIVNVQDLVKLETIPSFPKPKKKKLR